MDTLLLSEQEVAELLFMDEVLEVVELAFRESALGYTQMPPKMYLQYTQYHGDLRTMPAYLERLDMSAVKIVNVHPNNMKEHGLPTVMATILLIEPKTGRLLSVMGGRNITAMRTGAAGGIAAKYLARKDSKTAGFVGSGVQARTQLAALLQVFPRLNEIRVWDVWLEAAEAFAFEIKSRHPHLQTKVAISVESAVEGADIVVTTTPATQPVVQNEWVSEGTHLNCIGADAPGKEEIDPAILRRAKIVVDDWEQASHSGEINIPVSKGMINRDSVWAELGEIVAGVKPGRASPREITVFDATGLAIQDAVTAELVHRKAIQRKKGHAITI
ncbi:MAG: alanine dehydrogenase [Candidatus Bathyarchaeia archaeon]